MLFKKTVKKIQTDLFIKRLRSSVIGEGMLHEGNIFLIDYAIRNMPDEGIVFEIGSYGGLSTNLILHLLKKHNKGNHLFGCDPWIYEGYNDYKETAPLHIDGREDLERNKYMTYIKNAFINAALLLHPEKLPFTAHLKSDALFEKWDRNEEFVDVFGRNFSMPNKIAFCYIDGDHSYEQTKKDFENVDSKLQPKGFILIDDSAKNLNFGSANFVKEIMKNPNFRLIDTNPNYLFQKKE